MDPCVWGALGHLDFDFVPGDHLVEFLEWNDPRVLDLCYRDPFRMTWLPPAGLEMLDGMLHPRLEVLVDSELLKGSFVLLLRPRLWGLLRVCYWRTLHQLS